VYKSLGFPWASRIYSYVEYSSFSRLIAGLTLDAERRSLSRFLPSLSQRQVVADE
jgi:hypothetical protein